MKSTDYVSTATSAEKRGSQIAVVMNREGSYTARSADRRWSAEGATQTEAEANLLELIERQEEMTGVAKHAELAVDDDEILAEDA